MAVAKASKSSPAITAVPASLHTPEQIEALLFELDAYIGWRRRQETKLRAKVASQTKSALPNWTSELEDLLGTPEQVAKLTLPELEARSDELKTWRHFPVVSLTLPVRPPAALRNDLVTWFRREISQQLLVKFSVNSSTVGGIVVRTPKRIHDFSFRQLLQDKQASIPEILKRPVDKKLTTKSK